MLPLNSHLSVELQLASAGSMGIDGEIRRFVHDAAQRLQTWTVTLHLRTRGMFNSQTRRKAFAAQQESDVTFSGKTSLAAGRMWAMKGLSLMSSSSHITWTA